MATWYIIDGDLPFLEEFPAMPTIDDAPATIWRITDGDLPYKIQFPKMYKVSAGSKLYFGSRIIKKIYLGDTKIKSLYNGDTKIL